MKLSARNILKGKIVEVKRDRRPPTFASTSAAAPSSPPRSPTKPWMSELAAGQSASAVIKASDVMIAID